MQTVLTEIAGLLVLTRILTFLLRSFNEWRFNRKTKKETNEEFREIFTYENFKRIMVENQANKAENKEIKTKNKELETKYQET